MKKLIARVIDKVIGTFTSKSLYLSDQHYILERSDSASGQRDWSVTHAGLDKLLYQGEGEKVGILDTGVDVSHSDLKGRVELVNYVADSADTDEMGHGTFCAGEILGNGVGNGIGKHGVIGVAPMARGLCCKVLHGDSRDGSLVNFDKVLCSAIEKCYQEGCGVISMSIGFDSRSYMVENALKEAVNHGIIPVAACGNDGMRGSLSKVYPASYTSCISVSSANEKGMPSWFSTVGKGEIVEEQPEVAVASLEYYWGCFPPNRYGKMIGTSMACPIVAGTALLWREAMRKKGMLPNGPDVLKQFRVWLKSVSRDVNENGWDSSLGWGVLMIKEGDLC
jgi:subtilisin